MEVGLSSHSPCRRPADTCLYSNRCERTALAISHGEPQWQPTLIKTSSLLSIERAFVEPSPYAKFHPALMDLRTGGGYRQDDRGVVGHHSSANSLWGYRGASSPLVERCTYIHRVFKEFATHFISSESESLAITDSPHLLYSWRARCSLGSGKSPPITPWALTPSAMTEILDGEEDQRISPGAYSFPVRRCHFLCCS